MDRKDRSGFDGFRKNISTLEHIHIFSAEPIHFFNLGNHLTNILTNLFIRDMILGKNE